MARLSKKNEELLRAVQKQASHEDRVPSTSAVGLGVDLLEIERMERALERTPRILERVFTSGEREYAWSKAKPAVHYATFFAAREAVLKALGCGFSGVEYTDVEISHNEKGKPEVVLHGNALAIAEEQGVVEIQISLSHTHQMAVASAVAIKAQSSPQKKEVTDPMEELARQFKELRSMLDDLGVNAIIDEEHKKEEQGVTTEAIDFEEADALEQPDEQETSQQPEQQEISRQPEELRTLKQPEELDETNEHESSDGLRKRTDQEQE